MDTLLDAAAVDNDEDAPRATADFHFAMIPEYVLYHPDLIATDVRLFGILHRFANGSGRAWPSIKTLGEMLGRSSHQTVRDSIKRLIAAGAVTVEVGYRDDGSQTSNSYTIHMVPRPDPPSNSAPQDPLWSASRRLPENPEGSSDGLGAMNDSQVTRAKEPKTPRVAVRKKRALARGTSPPDGEKPEPAGKCSPEARRIAAVHWEQVKARTGKAPLLAANGSGSPFMALAGLVGRCLEAGFAEDEILWALPQAAAYTLSSIQFAMRRRPDALDSIREALHRAEGRRQ